MDIPTSDGAADAAVFEVASDLLAAMCRCEGHGIDTARAPQMCHVLARGLVDEHVAWLMAKKVAAFEGDNDDEPPPAHSTGPPDCP